MESIARRYALRTSSSDTTNLILFQRSGKSSHWWALTATCVPSGLVKTNTSPTTALSGMIISDAWHTDVATPPMVSQGFITDWPPVTLQPASSAQSCDVWNSLNTCSRKETQCIARFTLKPLIIKGTTMSRSFSDIFVETPRSMSMLSQFSTPMAYKSLRTFAAAILPASNFRVT